MRLRRPCGGQHQVKSFIGLHQSSSKRSRAPSRWQCHQPVCCSPFDISQPMALAQCDPDYRPNVGCCLYKAGLVWVGRRVQSTSGGGSQRWQMPQGGIDAGEEPAVAAMRELQEETGVTSATIVAETDGWLHYSFLSDQKQRFWKDYKGQAQKWFLMRFEGDDSEICLDAHKEEIEFDAYAWRPFAEVVEQIVPFKQQVYEAVREQFEPLINKDAQSKKV